LHWDNNEKINYAFFTHDWLNEYIFVEDDQSFKAKLDLAKKYNLRGISVFYIGIEDPRIWNVLG
jgi:spore germination protein YaaH